MNPTPPGPSASRTTFKVRIDRMGSMLIDCHAGSEMTETGVRGLVNLVHSGLMAAPHDIHVDPLLRHVEIDGIRFTCDAAGAQRLEQVLNDRYSREIVNTPASIKVRENDASPTGFDLHYVTVRHGVRHEYNVHLVAEELEKLTDPSRCDLIRPDAVIRLNSPFLIARQRLGSGAEIPIPGLPDVEYRHATVEIIQRIFNHPAVIRNPGVPAEVEPAPVDLRFREIRIVTHPGDKALLWLECVPADGGPIVSRALTHQNIADLMHQGVFLENLEVLVSLDHRRIGVFDHKDKSERHAVVHPASPADDLNSAGRLLTESLRPPTAIPTPIPTPSTSSTPVKVNSTPPPHAAPVVLPPATPPALELAKPRLAAAPQPSTPAPSPPQAPPAPPPKPVPPIPSDLAALFTADDPVRINQSIFEALAADAELSVLDVHLSLPHVFHQRRFRILNFDATPIETVMDLRGEVFYGVYLADLPNHGSDLVYACRGVHVEWGLDKCVLQPAHRAESAEYKGHALLGLAQDKDGPFVFIVEPGYRDWVKPHAAACAAANATFATLAEFAAMRDRCVLIWPS